MNMMNTHKIEDVEAASRVNRFIVIQEKKFTV